MIWKLLGGGIALAIGAFLIWQYGASREAKGAAKRDAIWQREVSALGVRLARKSARQQVAWANRSIQALEDFSSNQARIDPIIIRATDKVTIYAKTPDGAALCLPAERVRSIAADRTSLFPAHPAAATSGPAPLLPDGFATQP